MSRPQQNRDIAVAPPYRVVKPGGVPMRELAMVQLALDEFEAIRLADHEGLYQEDAAAAMGVSRPTFGRILENARRAVARALVEGAALIIEGGTVTMQGKREFVCDACGHRWQEPFGTGRPEACPACKEKQIHRADGCGGHGHGHGCGRGRRWRMRQVSKTD